MFQKLSLCVEFYGKIDTVMKNRSELSKEIETLRSKLVEIAQNKDLSSPEVIEVSRQLNQLLNAYDALTVKPDAGFVAKEHSIVVRKDVTIDAMVKNILKDKLMTNDELAQKIGLSRCRVNRILNGAGTKFKTIMLIANALGLSVDKIITKTEQPKEVSQMVDHRQPKELFNQDQAISEEKSVCDLYFQDGFRAAMRLCQTYIKAGPEQKRKIENYVDDLLHKGVITGD
ncbi:MAG: Spo0E family sporulation regulatory protein-aspartic acid phosphatase [Firmicutes bacterium]|nr:Spo0E family sporulation regulatory protein-aspartic acid phosphatase [Bacillota bacterium]